MEAGISEIQYRNGIGVATVQVSFDIDEKDKIMESASHQHLLKHRAIEELVAHFFRD